MPGWAECRGGVHDCPRSIVGERTKRSMSGPPLCLQVPLTTVACGATLELSQAKTHITHIENGFDFLGQHVRKYAGKLLIKPAPKKVHTFLGNIRHIVKANK